MTDWNHCPAWHDYPQRPNAHPERPWWVRVYDRFSVPAWRRPTDGLLGPSESGQLGPHEYDYVLDQLAHLDRENPLPAPEPRCGQVWLWLEDDEKEAGTSATVLFVDSTEVAFMGPCTYSRDGWPPAGAVLVAGPGGPWAPLELP